MPEHAREFIQSLVQHDSARRWADQPRLPLLIPARLSMLSTAVPLTTKVLFGVHVHIVVCIYRPSAEQLLCDSRLPGKIVSDSKADCSVSHACVDASHYQYRMFVLVKEVENNFVEEAMRVISKDTEPFQKLLVRPSSEIVIHSHTRE